jgi:hypothetical protein
MQLGTLNFIFLADEDKSYDHGDHNDYHTCQQAVEEIY